MRSARRGVDRQDAGRQVGAWMRRALTGALAALPSRRSRFRPWPRPPCPAALTQYSNGTDNWATTGAVPAAYALGVDVGVPGPDPTPGTVAALRLRERPRPLSLARARPARARPCSTPRATSTRRRPRPGPHLRSTRACRRRRPPRITSSPPAAPAAARCRWGCSGYVLDSAPLDRYNGGRSLGDDGVAAQRLRPRGHPRIPDHAGPDTNPLYGCIQNSDQFLVHGPRM